MKYMKMAAIALMALALFSCNNKNNEPKNEVAQLSIRINDAQLRAMMDPAETDAKTLITDNVVLTLDNGEQITLDADAIAKAKSADGYKKPVTEVVKTVSLVANGKIENDTDITTLQGKDIATEIALTAPATAVTTTVKDGMTTYSVELSPVPAVARLEVAGKIKPVANANGKQAFKDITVEHVYVNNYLSTIAGTRHMCVTNGKDGFAAAPAPQPQTQMNDKIEAADKEAFEKIEKVAGYYLFPKLATETPTSPDYFDHVILKIKITYTDEALAADGNLANMTDRYVTIARFMKSATGDLDGGFLAGTIYKLDLNELSKDFKTGDDGKPDPKNPDTPDPEPTANKQLVVKVKPYTWTTENIKPDVNNGYKK